MKYLHFGNAEDFKVYEGDRTNTAAEALEGLENLSDRIDVKVPADSTGDVEIRISGMGLNEQLTIVYPVIVDKEIFLLFNKKDTPTKEFFNVSNNVNLATQKMDGDNSDITGQTVGERTAVIQLEKKTWVAKLDGKKHEGEPLDIPFGSNEVYNYDEETNDVTRISTSGRNLRTLRNLRSLWRRLPASSGN